MLELEYSLLLGVCQLYYLHCLNAGVILLGKNRRHNKWIRNQDSLDKFIEEWTAQHDPFEVMHLLQSARVAAGAVVDASEFLKEWEAGQRRQN